MRKRQHLYPEFMKANRYFLTDKPRFLLLLLLLAALSVVAMLLITSSLKHVSSRNSLFISSKASVMPVVEANGYRTTPTQLLAILHYATSRVVPQQSHAEISLAFDVLKARAPCNFLVFGLGHDSLMWASLNPLGYTLFLEEDPSWVQNILRNAPGLHVHVVKYETRLHEADRLLSRYKQNQDCTSNTKLKGNKKCKLALSGLPDEVYDREWDVIMIDAPRGYFAEAPGRMAAIFSVAVMARAKKEAGVTDVFLHDVNRRVERVYAEEFLCDKNLVKAAGRLWHFRIPSAAANLGDSNEKSSFC